MAQWQMKLDFSKAKNLYREDKIKLDELAAKVVEVIKASLPEAKLVDVEMEQQLKDEVLVLFEEIADDDSQAYTEKDFNFALEALYDWADTPLDDRLFGGKKMCWIVPDFD